MNGTYATTTPVLQTGPKRIDDFLRRELRVNDPRNPVEVVTALRRRYAADAARLDQEAAGLPIRYQAQPAMMTFAPAADTPGSREERRVQADLESDLAALIESRDNREWAPEIRGWRDALLREVAEGTASARFAQDPAMRDRGFLALRKLGEYARVARLVGVMNLQLNADYRRLASTLDNAGNVIRILMGEALYQAGLSEGGFITQVPVTDIRVRRDSLVLAVRRLSGAVESTDDGEWGDAVAAYRGLLDELDRRSAPELSVYLREEFLVQVLDGLVGSVSRQDPESLRQVASTAPVEIARLNRLVVIAMPLGDQFAQTPMSAALSFFVQSLRLFVDAFRATRSGARLIDLAVPLPMAAHQSDEPDRDSRRILREIVSRRGDYAAENECFLACCGTGGAELARQVRLDKVLFDIDRAIDLYALGESTAPNWGDDPSRPGVFSEERRAAAYSVILRKMITELDALATADKRPALVSALTAIANELDDALPAPPGRDPLIRDVFDEQRQGELDWRTLVESLAPRCLDQGRGTLAGSALVLLEGVTFDARKTFLQPPPSRIALMGIRDELARQRAEGSDGSLADAVDYANANGARQELDDLVKKWVKDKKDQDQTPGADPDLLDFVKTLESASGSLGELNTALNTKRVRLQMASLKARGVLPHDLEQALEPAFDQSKQTQIDMNSVREMFKRILSS